MSAKKKKKKNANTTQFPKAHDDILKCLVLSSHQSKGYLVTITQAEGKQQTLTFEKYAS